MTTTNQASFFTLPFVDGYFWSKPPEIAGMRLKALINGEEMLVEGNDPVVSDSIPGVLNVSWPVNTFDGILLMHINEREIHMKMEGNTRDIAWYFDLDAAADASLPFRMIDKNNVDCQFDGVNYSVEVSEGSLVKRGNTFRILPERNSLVLKLDNDH